jgi:hypothetical protein
MTLNKDVFQPHESVEINVALDNSLCSEDLKKIQFKVYREISSISAHGHEFKDKHKIMKRDLEGVEANHKAEKKVEFHLDVINLSDKYLNSFKLKKRHIVADLEQFATSLQPSIKTKTFECHYYIEASFTHGGLLSNKVDKIILPFSIFYGNEELKASEKPFMGRSKTLGKQSSTPSEHF